MENLQEIFENETSNGLNDTGWGQETLDKLTIQLSKVGNSLPQFSDTYRLGFSCSSQYDKDRCWMLLWHIDDPEYPNWDRVCLQGYDKKSLLECTSVFCFLIIYRLETVLFRSSRNLVEIFFHAVVCDTLYEHSSFF